MDLYELVNELEASLTPETFSDPRIQEKLELVPLGAREELARRTKTVAYYFGDEVATLRRDEEEAALRAAPPGFSLAELNGINLGCGDRKVAPTLIGVDAHGDHWSLGGQDYQSAGTLRCWVDDLPFKDSTVDFAIALHVLEHLPNPIATIHEWLRVLKPGGGLGLVLPDWRYTWDARNDRDPWSHRWNPTPEFFVALFEEHLSPYCTLEHFNSYPWKMSFDVVLRKPGEFACFRPLDTELPPTGYELWTDAPEAFLHGDH